MCRANHPGLDALAPHALDHGAYADGTAMPEAMLALEASDPFWQTLGGSVDDPFGDGGETFRQRQQAAELGIGLNLYARVVEKSRTCDFQTVAPAPDTDA